MPQYKTHLVGGVAAFLICLFCILKIIHPTIPVLFEWLLCALIGSLFPDVDIKSKGQLSVYWLISLLVGYYIMFRHDYRIAAWISFLAFLPLLVRHRGIFHSFAFIVFIELIGFCFVVAYSPHLARIVAYDLLFFTAGVLNHLLLDYGIRRFIS